MAPAEPVGRAVVYLHIGTPKSGTTYLQSVLWHNSAALRDDGVLYTGEEKTAHALASFDLQGIVHDGEPNPLMEGAWDRTVKAARTWGGRTIISHETLGTADRVQIDRVLDDLAFAEVHLIVTVRDLVRQIPAVWQEDLKNRNTLSFAEFLEAVRAPERPEHHILGRIFWRMQDTVDNLARWTREIPKERVHIVTVPPPAAPRGLLWERFAEVTRLTADAYDTSAVVSNTSLGVVEAKLLSRYNAALETCDFDFEYPFDWPIYTRFVKNFLAQEMLVQRPGQTKIVLPPEEHGWVTERGAGMIEGLRQAGYQVVGDLAELTPVQAATSGPVRHPDEVTETELLDASCDAITLLLDEVHRLRRELRDTNKEFALAYSRPLVRHAAHRVGLRYTPVMKLLESLAAKRGEEAPLTTAPQPDKE